MAKNSDRPAMECQPLVQLPRGAHGGTERPLVADQFEVAVDGEVAAAPGARRNVAEAREAVGRRAESLLGQRADLNGSNRIDGFDLNDVGRLLGTAASDPGYRRRIDVDLNGQVDGDDLVSVAGAARATSANRANGRASGSPRTSSW